MALANDMSLLLNKISNRLGLKPLEPHLPDFVAKDKWADVVMTDTMVTFSRYFPNKFPMVINDETCDKKMENGVTYYYIKDEMLKGLKLLGIMDIDWSDSTPNNFSVGSSYMGTGDYLPQFGCPAATFESIVALQTQADFSSLYNKGLFIDFQYPNRFSIKGLGNKSYDLTSFVLVLLVEHCSLSTISPTMMEAFENLAQCDIAKFLYMNLRYYDGFETAYINIDLKLSELQSEGDKRDNIIDEIKNSYVSASNNAIPYIWGTA